MNEYSLAGDLIARSGTSPSLQSKNPAFARRMAARLALEAMRIEKAAREAVREVWEESTEPDRCFDPAPQAA